MRINGPELLQPVFDYLDGLIRDHGDTLVMVFANAVIPFLIWVLCGGLRRKLLKGKPMAHVPTVIVIPLQGRSSQLPETFDPFSPHHQFPQDDLD